MEHDLLNDLGFETKEIDLREYFSRSDELCLALEHSIVYG